MRVISGKAKGTNLSSIESLSTRPTLDRVKESLFNIIQEKINDSIVLDLFAGSGALGIEALSRGAKKAYFCDNNYDAIKMIKKNIEKTHFLNQSVIINSNYKKCLQCLNEKFDIIFIDPPYKDNLSVDSIKIIIEQGILNKDALMIIETDEICRDKRNLEELKNIMIIDERKYGRASLLFIKEEN